MSNKNFVVKSILADDTLLDNSCEVLSHCRKLEHLLIMLQQQADRDDNGLYSDVLCLAIETAGKIHDQIDREIKYPIFRASFENYIGG